MAGTDRRLTLTLSAVLVIVLLIGGTVAYAVGRSQGVAGQASSDHRPTSPTTPTTPGNDATSGTSAPVTTGASGPSGTTHPGSGSGTGPVQVTLSPSAEGAAQAATVKELLTRYFTAINRHNFDGWLATVTAEQEHRERDTWLHDYSTTHDSDIYVSDITPGDPMTVRMQFVSHQSVALAPKSLPASCIRWDVTYKVVDEGVGLRVGNSTEAPAMVKC